MGSEEFLRRFRVLEDVLEEKYVGRRRQSSSVVMEYLADPESLPWREQLDLCREVRNILTHNAELGGKPVVQPAEALLDMLDQIIEYAQRPPLALDFATKAEQLLCADVGQRALEVMRAMEKRGFSHVPVLAKGEMIGVFSMGTVFSYAIRDMGYAGITKETRIRDFMAWLPIENHTSEVFGFIDCEATYADVKTAFEGIKRGKKRLAALFITESGNEKEPLLGMVTPWDALGKHS